MEQCLEKQKQDLMLLPYSNCSKFCQCVPKETLEDGTVLYSWQVKECALGAYWSHRSRQCGETNPEACKGRRSFLILIFILSDDKILDLSTLKAFADNKINVAEKFKFVFGRVENIVEERENAGYHHFLLFPHIV